MNPTFTRATRSQVPLKLGITGPSGSGKTTAALNIAYGLVGNAPIALLDTENGSASLYADMVPFDALNMTAPYAVEKFLAAIEAAVAGGYKALIIDSASHEWIQILQDKEAVDARGGNSFSNWAPFTKKHETFLTAIRNAPIHLILCLRGKEKHEINDQKKVVKLGMGSQMRDGFEFELTTVFDLDMNHQAKTSKDRTRLFDGRLEPITVKTGQELAAWLASGAVLTPEVDPKREALERPAETLGQVAQNVAEAVTTKPEEPNDFVDGLTPLPQTITTEQYMNVVDACAKGGVDIPALTAYCAAQGYLAGEGLKSLKPDLYNNLLTNLKDGRRRAGLVAKLNAA